MSDFSAHAAKRHHLLEHEFTGVAAGGGDEATIARLQAAERSRRLLLLRAVMEAAPPQVDTHGLPSLREQWQLLLEAQKRASEAVETVLLHPQLGTWAGSVLRRFLGKSPAPVPLWAELAYLAGLAATCAIRAGIDFTGRIAVHKGMVVLPTLGFAVLDGETEWDVTQIRCRSGRVVIGPPFGRVELPERPDLDAGNWFEMRELRAEEDGLMYRLAFDEVDPYREPGRIQPPHRIDLASLSHWQRLFSSAWTELVRHHRDSAGPLSKGLGTVVPRPSAGRFRASSGTSEESIGSACISLPPDATSFAVTLLHEFQHSKLGSVLHIAPMYSGDADERLYAPWRSDPRPVPSLLQGVYAFLGVTRFWRDHRNATTGDAARVAQFEFAHWRGQTWHACRTLRAQAGLTDLGRRFVAQMGDCLESWQDDPVPADLLALAKATVADNRAMWRIRHVHPAMTDVERLADAWLDGRPQPALRVRESVTAAGRSTRPECRSTLIRLRVADPTAFQGFVAAPTPELFSDLVPGDIAYVTGDQTAAIRTYRQQIETDPNRTAAWVGLGLALAAIGHRAPANALLERPERVQAVYQEISRRKDIPPAPEAVAAWLGV